MRILENEVEGGRKWKDGKTGQFPELLMKAYNRDFLIGLFVCFAYKVRNFLPKTIEPILNWKDKVPREKTRSRSKSTLSCRNIKDPTFRETWRIYKSRSVEVFRCLSTLIANRRKSYWVIVWNILFYVQDLTNRGQKAEKDGQNGEQSKVSATANDDVSLIIYFSYCDVLIFLKNV